MRTISAARHGDTPTPEENTLPASTTPGLSVHLSGIRARVRFGGSLVRNPRGCDAMGQGVEITSAT